MLGWTRYVPDARRRRRGGRGKIALAHMKEFPDYYERLKRMEAEAERDWQRRSPDGPVADHPPRHEMHLVRRPASLRR
jgi:hypothetical protein